MHLHDHARKLIQDKITLPGVADNTQVGSIAACMFNDRVGIELLASTPFKHDLLHLAPDSIVGFRRERWMLISIFPRAGGCRPR